MVSFELTEEQRMIQDTAHKFAENEIRPAAAHYDEIEEFPYPVIQKAVQVGLTEMPGDPSDTSGITSYLVGEELNWGCAGIGNAIMSSGLGLGALLVMGTPEQRERLTPLCTSTPDEVRLSAMGLTEPSAGSDVSALSTTAVKDGDEYVLNGTKCFITNGGIADVHIIFATTDKSQGWRSMAAFAIEKGTPGLSMGKKEKKMGIRASHTAEVVMDDCRVPAQNRLGGEPPPKKEGEEKKSRRSGSGGLGALTMLEYSRPSVGASAVGLARAAFEYAVEYAKERVQFGKPIIEHQAIGFMLAQMAMEIDAARLLIWRAGWMMRNGVRFRRAEGSMSKLYAGDLAMKVTTQAVQILGGYGYMRDYPVEKWMRDAKIFQIFEGTAEVQRIVISRALARG